MVIMTTRPLLSLLNALTGHLVAVNEVCVLVTLGGPAGGVEAALTGGPPLGLFPVLAPEVEEVECRSDDDENGHGDEDDGGAAIFWMKRRASGLVVSRGCSSKQTRAGLTLGTFVRREEPCRLEIVFLNERVLHPEGMTGQEDLQRFRPSSLR